MAHILRLDSAEDAYRGLAIYKDLKTLTDHVYNPDMSTVGRNIIIDYQRVELMMGNIEKYEDEVGFDNDIFELGFDELVEKIREIEKYYEDKDNIACPLCNYHPCDC